MPDVSEEMAHEELYRFLRAMDIDTDSDEDDEGQYDIIIKNLVAGHLVIDDIGQPVYHPKLGGDPITFYEPTGASYMAMDKRGRKTQGAAEDSAAKMFRLMADMTKTNPQLFAKMRNRDLKVCMAVATVFLAG